MQKVIDKTGRRYHSLVVQKFSGMRERDYMWECLCDCGNTHLVASRNLNKNGVKSCGKCKKKVYTSQKIDLTGRRFGDLKVIGQSEIRIKAGNKWLCRCSCGDLVSFSYSTLIKGNTKNCGCQKVIINSSYYPAFSRYSKTPKLITIEEWSERILKKRREGIPLVNIMND